LPAAPGREDRREERERLDRSVAARHTAAALLAAQTLEQVYEDEARRALARN
jgi:hypothetical protein